MKKGYYNQILKLLGEAGESSLNKSELAKKLGVTPKNRSFFRKALRNLEEQGKVVCGKKSRYSLAGSGKSGVEEIEGVLRISGRDPKRVAATFYADNESQLPRSLENPDRGIFVPRHATGTALSGDRVQIVLQKRSAPKWHRYAKKHRQRSKTAQRDSEVQWQGRVVRVVERMERSIVGKFHRRGHSAVLAPEDPHLPKIFTLKEVSSRAQPNDLVVAEFVSWDSAQLPPVVRMTKVLGQEGEKGVDILSVIHRYGLRTDFPSDVVSEASLIDEEIDEAEISNREDWREREVFTIDPEDARDFDDAISVRKLDRDSGWELAVHIADVSHYVRPGSALDREAKRRGNSVYLADRVLPMLPEKLSNGVCSLKPDVDRLTMAAIITFGPKGTMKSARFVRAVIRSQRRYTYEDAYHWMQMPVDQIQKLDDKKEKRYASLLHRAWELGALLRAKRLRGGAFDMDFPEVRAVLDEQGRAIDVKTSLYDESHQLIEECMLAANEAVAKELKNAGAPCIYRIHEDPDPAKLDEYADLVRSFGYRCGDLNIRAELQKMMKSIKGSAEEQSLKIGLLKSLRRAAYSKDPLGHYGLAKVNYTHFTSPIRRYADLVVHRALKRFLFLKKMETAEELPPKTPNEAGMSDIASHISRTERVAADAEMDTQRLKLMEYLERLCSENQSRNFVALVTDLRPIGVFVELEDLRIKGMIRKIDLPSRKDFFFSRSKNCYVSRQTREAISLGDRLRVRLLRIDRGRGFVDFALDQ